MAKTSGDGSVKQVGAANITKGDIQNQLGADGDGNITADRAKELGLLGADGTTLTDKGKELLGDKAVTDGKLNVSGINTFEKLNKVNPGLAEKLFDSKSHDIKLSEADGFMDALKGVEGVAPTFKIEVEEKLKADGKITSGWDKAGNVAKSTLNGVIKMADEVVPFFQALLAAKDKAANTSEELQMAMEKYAAAMKKLKQIEMLIMNAGEASANATNLNA